MRQIFQNDLRHVGQRALGVFFENENRVLRADLFHFRLQRGGDVAGRFVGDDRDPLVRLEAQTNADGVARAGRKFRIDGDRW